MPGPSPGGDAPPADAPPADGVRYATEVVAVGTMIPEFRAQGLLVFFGEMAPAELHDFAVLHRPSVVHSAPDPGDVVELDGVLFTVTCVGHVAPENLLRLGHVCLKADGSTVPPLPGDVCVEVGELPELAPGSVVRILARPAPSADTTASAKEPT